MSRSAARAAAAPTSAAPIEERAKGQVGPDERDRVQAMTSAVPVHHRRVVDHTRVRLTGSNCPGGPGLVQANPRVCGAPARIQVAGRSTAQAVATAAARPQRQTRRLSTAWQPWPWPDPQRRPLGIPGAGAIARLKTYRLHLGMPCQTAAVQNATGYDVHHYTDTGEDAIVHRAGPGRPGRGWPASTACLRRRCRSPCR